MFGDNFDIGSSGNRQILSREEYLKYGGLGVTFILLIVLYVFEFKYFNLALGIKPLILGALLFGLLLGLFLGYRFRKSGTDLTERVQIYVFFVFLCVIFMPLFASLSNRLLSFNAIHQEEVEFVEQNASYSSRMGVIKGEHIKPNNYHSFFYRDNQLYRVKTKSPLFSPDQERGDRVSISVQKGLWGIEWVKEDHK